MLTYPNKADEKRIFTEETQKKSEKIKKSTYEKLTPGDILEIIDYIAENIHVEGKIFDYVSDILTKMRELTESPKIPLK